MAMCHPSVSTGSSGMGRVIHVPLKMGRSSEPHRTGNILAENERGRSKFSSVSIAIGESSCNWLSLWFTQGPIHQIGNRQFLSLENNCHGSGLGVVRHVPAVIPCVLIGVKRDIMLV